MKVLIHGSRLKVMSKSVRLLSKYSREVNLSANEEGMTLQATNNSKSAFVEIFFAKNFFLEYFGGDPFVPFECQVDIKSLVLVFRVINLDRIMESCKILMDNRVCKIFFEMKGKNKVTRFYHIPYMEHEVLACPKVSEKVGDPSLRASAKVFHEIFKNFTMSTKEATFWMFDNNIRFKTFIEKDDKKYFNTPITSFVYRAKDFSNYNYKQQLSISFNIKDLKPFLDFALFKNQMIGAYFQTEEGKPIEFSFYNQIDSYRANIVVATFEFPANEGPIAPPYNPRIVHDSSQNTSINESVDLSSPLSPEPGDAQFGFISNINYAATHLPANPGRPRANISQRNNLNDNANNNFHGSGSSLGRSSEATANEDINIAENNENIPEVPTQNANCPNLPPNHGLNPADDFENIFSQDPDFDVANIEEIINRLPAEGDTPLSRPVESNVPMEVCPGSASEVSESEISNIGEINVNRLPAEGDSRVESTGPVEDFAGSASEIPESDDSNIQEIIDKLPDFSSNRGNNSSFFTDLSGPNLAEFKRTYLYGLDESKYDSEFSHFASSSDDDDDTSF